MRSNCSLRRFPGCWRLSIPELPPPLPPDQRTVGQLVAESIRAYGQNFWRCLPLGLPLAAADQLSAHHTIAVQAVVFWLLAPLFVAAYVGACGIVLGGRATNTALVVALLVYLPFPALRALFILPGLAWFGFIGLAVPVAMVEGAGFRESLVRGRRLGLADFVHAFGSLCALVIVVGVAANTLGALLHSQSDTGLRIAVFLSDLVLSPLLYLGAALLYTDQAARSRTATRPSRAASSAASTSDALTSGGHADLHPALDADPAGSADAQIEP